ncbi:MAG TPA: lipid II flippase MurJ, partial [Cryptosporangiaceae bacterium]|nr:lipid II flippase MurJ [Cryptosporangiaceae bacterium]
MTVLARLVGFGRVFVFTWAVGYNTVGDIYQAVNTIPNVVFEIVAGGALASVVVPLLAGAAGRGDRATVDRSASALLTWTVAVLTPLAIVLALTAGPIVEALRPDTASAADLALGRLLLVLFAPQLVLYGIGIVLTGVLQAHRRFLWPAVAPLLSSATVIGCYLAYAAVGGAADPAELSTTAATVLAVGTTLGVAVLSLCLLVPLRGTPVRLRPAFGFPPDASAQARRLVGSGVAAVAGQQVALVVVLKLASDARGGSLVAYTVAQTLFLLPWAVLAVPVATSAFPRLVAAFDTGDLPAYRSTLRTAAHTVIALSACAAAVLVACAGPLATVVTSVGEAGVDATGPVARAIALFAPGLLGYGLLALLARALYAAGAAWPTALATLGGWSVVVAADLTLAAVLPLADRVP